MLHLFGKLRAEHFRLGAVCSEWHKCSRQTRGETPRFKGAESGQNLNPELWTTNRVEPRHMILCGNLCRCPCSYKLQKLARNKTVLLVKFAEKQNPHPSNPRRNLLVLLNYVKLPTQPIMQCAICVKYVLTVFRFNCVENCLLLV